MPKIEHMVLPIGQTPPGSGWKTWGGNHLINSWWRVTLDQGDGTKLVLFHKKDWLWTEPT